MTTDIRTLLHDAADEPERAPDIGGALQSARKRRRRHRGIGALAAVVALALVVGLVMVDGGGGDDRQIAVGLRQSGSQIPDGWKTVTADAGISIAIPPGWDTYDFGRTDVAMRRISVGTGALPGDGSPVACVASEDMREDMVVPDAPGTWVAVWEYADANAPDFPLPGAGGAALAGIGERPVSFAGLATTGGSCDQLGNDSRSALAAAFAQRVFFDGGRAIAVKVVTVTSAGAKPDLTTAGQVLDTLRVEPLAATTTTSPYFGVVPPPIPTAPTPTEPPFAGTTDDERMVAQAFITWMDDQSDAGLDASVEAPDAVRVPSHEGWGQHTPEDLAQYEGRVESVRVIDADHAQVVYTILHAGQVAFSKRLGSAVRVDGQWKVSTETVCGMLSLGGITCPA